MSKAKENAGEGGVSVDAATAAEYNVNPATGATIMRETLSGALAARYGVLPLVALPGDNEPLMGFLLDVADILRGVGIYRRDYLIVLPDCEKRRLREMKPEMFCSWSQRYFMGFKTRYDANDEPYVVTKDIPTDVAIKTLASGVVLESVPEIERVLPVPLPFFSDEGTLDVLPVGFYEPRGAFTYDL